jgi:uncharacterized protein Yka (UPF0111/DUF47 family)/phosphohistidine swiveling domain-containing protein
MSKSRIIEILGEDHLRLPGLVNRALAANDRVKYLLTLIQAARASADGAEKLDGLQAERRTSGLDDPELDLVVAGSEYEPNGSYHVPGAQKLVRQALAEVDTMLAPLETAGAAEAAGIRTRLDLLASDLNAGDDRLTAEQITRLTAGPGQADASLHMIVMDAHRALNALAQRIATESIEGASVYRLEDGDAAVVRAFMRGVHSTERLKFDHPGLGTIATRTDSELVIENDLGTTDAHVVVIKIAERVATVTYTDVHLTRLLFFQDLLQPFAVSWDDTRSRSDKQIEGGLFHLANGSFTARDDAELERFVQHLGSRLVFIIDWNRARKRIRRLVGRRSAIELLRWAAEHGYGHMAFLRAGADGLVYEALEFAGGRAVRPGESLEDVLGSKPARAYLQAVLRICSEGLQGQRPLSLVQDEVRAELTVYLRSARQEIHELALRHAELSVEIAEAARDALEQAVVHAPERCRAAGARARNAEHEADGLVSEARSSVDRSPDLKPWLDLIEAADDIADCGEEAAFYATLLVDLEIPDGVRLHTRRIARLVLAASREHLRAMQLSAEVTRGGPREEMDAFLEAAHRVIELEHETDEAQRGVHQALVAETRGSGPALFATVELTRGFEEAADALMHSAHLLREQTLARVAGSEPSLRRGTGADPQRMLAYPVSALGREHLYVIGDPAAPVPDPGVLGAKAHGLARLARAGLRVPEAVVLKPSFARAQRDDPNRDTSLREMMMAATGLLAQRTGLTFGSARRPLVLSIRSGAPVSMPGMLETVLNVGMCDQSARGLIAQTGNARLAWDSYRRLIESYATVVCRCPQGPFAQALGEQLDAAEAQSWRELPTTALRKVVSADLERFADLTGRPFPQDPFEQLVAAAGAVLASWDGRKAREYRGIHGIPDDLGTAVIVQRMVFGNAGGLSGSGVGFTRDPALGERRLYMDFLLDSQGEDIVAGRRAVEGIEELALSAPELVAETDEVCERLEAEFEDAQEFELTVQEGELFLLQTRTAKRTPWAALQIATDQVHEGLITPAVALRRLERFDLEAIRRVHVVPNGGEVLARATPASVGVATGPLALDARSAERFAREGHPPVLVRPEMVTDDIAAIAVSAGVLTGSGSRTSHAAVIAREFGKPCLVGCDGLDLDSRARVATIGGRRLAEGETVCLDAESGLVFYGAPEVLEERPTAALDEVRAWRRGAADGDGGRE